MRKKFFEDELGDDFEDEFDGTMSLRHEGHFEDGSIGYVVFFVPKESMYYGGNVNDPDSWIDDGGCYDYSTYNILNEDDEIVGNQDDYEVVDGGWYDASGNRLLRKPFIDN